MKHFLFILLLPTVFFLNSFAADSPTPPASQVAVSKPASSSTISVTIVKVNEDKKSIEVDQPNKATRGELPLNKEMQDKLTQGLTLSQGDRVALEVDEKNTVTSIRPDKVIQISEQRRLFYLAMSAALLVLFSAIVLGIAGGGNILNRPGF